MLELLHREMTGLFIRHCCAKWINFLCFKMYNSHCNRLGWIVIFTGI